MNFNYTNYKIYYSGIKPQINSDECDYALREYLYQEFVKELKKEVGDEYYFDEEGAIAFSDIDDLYDNP